MKRRATHAWMLACLATLCWPLATASGQAPAEPLPIREMTLQTKDGVQLGVTYYEGSKNKDTVPVILLHDEKGSRADMAPLALLLQTEGHAVIVPDLRGHGTSTIKAGEARPLQADRLPMNEYINMAGPQGDLEACKAYLMERNRAGELNIEKLCVVGAGMGASVGICWAVVDWSWPVLATGKQGQDVKALVLISPRFVYKSLNLNQVLATPVVQKELDFYIAVGKADRAAEQDASRIYTMIERLRPTPTEPQNKDIFFDNTYDTRLQGTNLLSSGDTLMNRIVQFIDVRLVKQNYPWTQRGNPLAGN